MSYPDFRDQHSASFTESAIPERYWPTIYRKCNEQVADLGDYVRIEAREPTNSEEQKEERDPKAGWWTQKEFYDGKDYQVVVDCDSIDADDETNVFVAETLFLFKYQDRVRSLRMDVNSQKLIELMHFDMDKFESLDTKLQDELIDHNMLKLANNFNVNSEESVNEQETVWFLKDEITLNIAHSFSANFRAVAFFHYGFSKCYTILYPLKTLKNGDILTRNFITNGATPTRANKSLLDAELLPYFYTDLTHIPWKDIPRIPNFFRFKRTVEETLPNPQPKVKLCGGKIKVFAQYDYIKQYLTDPHFEITDEMTEANVFWLLQSFWDYKDFAKVKDRPLFVNQFPFEGVLTLKDLFSYVARRSYANPPWIMPTFDLFSELPELVSYYQTLKKEGKDHKFIIKPWNSSRSRELTITENVTTIVKLRNSYPKIVCKYIDDPVLFYRDDIDANVKFDLRFIVLLKSVEPLQLFVYKNFWIRFANKPFSLDDLENYQKHFTVMNYVDENADESEQIKQMTWQEFVDKFDQQYAPNIISSSGNNHNKGKNRKRPSVWEPILKKIYDSIKDCFQCAVSEPPPTGIAHNAQSRALYGIDVMLRNVREEDSLEMHPTILEVNFCPDCQRACEYYPNFYNEIFNLLFRNKSSSDIIQL